MLNNSIENALNLLINSELRLAYLYMSMSQCHFFNVNSVLAMMIERCMDCHQHDAKMLMAFVNECGGRVRLSQIDIDERYWHSKSDTIRGIQDNERELSSRLEEYYALSEQEHDYATMICLSQLMSAQAVIEQEIAQMLKTSGKKSGDNAGTLSGVKKLVEV